MISRVTCYMRNLFVCWHIYTRNKVPGLPWLWPPWCQWHRGGLRHVLTMRAAPLRGFQAAWVLTQWLQASNAGHHLQHLEDACSCAAGRVCSARALLRRAPRRPRLHPLHVARWLPKARDACQEGLSYAIYINDATLVRYTRLSGQNPRKSSKVAALHVI